jgi:hypothetical protein
LLLCRELYGVLKVGRWAKLQNLLFQTAEANRSDGHKMFVSKTRKAGTNWDIKDDGNVIIIYEAFVPV